MSDDKVLIGLDRVELVDMIHGGSCSEVPDDGGCAIRLRMELSGDPEVLTEIISQLKEGRVSVFTPLNRQDGNHATVDVGLVFTLPKEGGDYRYVEALIVEANKLIAEGKFQEAFSLWLMEHNHGHSGWVHSIEELFTKPAGQKEREYVRQLMEINLQVVAGLIASKPAKDVRFQVKFCLDRITKSAPPDLYQRARELRKIACSR